MRTERIQKEVGTAKENWMDIAIRDHLKDIRHYLG